MKPLEAFQSPLFIGASYTHMHISVFFLLTLSCPRDISGNNYGMCNAIACCLGGMKLSAAAGIAHEFHLDTSNLNYMHNSERYSLILHFILICFVPVD